MRQLLKLDGIEAEGEGKVQRKTEVSMPCIWHHMLIIVFSINRHTETPFIMTTMRFNELVAVD